MNRRAVVIPALATLALVLVAWIANAQAPHHHGGGAPAPSQPSDAAAGAERRWRVGMDELHEIGGVPRGWKFQLPQGDVARGRKAFADLECYKCHTLKGESFPAMAATAGNVGPDLTGMGAHHPAEYLAESILQPNRVILVGPGFTGPDGLSIMPSFGDSLTVSQLVDLVAFLKSQTAGADHDAHGASTVQREAVAGDYRVRLVYATGGQHAHGPQGAGGARGPARAHLMVFITDREYDEVVPYLPVTATVQSLGATAMTVRFTPMTGAQGFHYGADVTLPERTQKITLAIGATGMQVMGSSRYKRPVTIAFDWSTAAR